MLFCGAVRSLTSWLDAVVPFPIAFGAPGFRLAALDFDPKDAQVDLEGRVCLVSGANAGVGRATATALARAGAEVRLLCRNRERGEEARRAIAATARFPDRVVLDVVDLAELPSLRAYVETLPCPRVDVLVHNAGVMVHERIETRAGLELTFATNVVGPHLLTRLLEPKLSRGARIIFVSSGGMLTQRLDLEKLTAATGPFDGTVAYAQTKRAEVVLAERFAERLRERGVFVASMHPGWVDTRSLSEAMPRFYRLTRRLLRTPDQGADTIVWLASSPRLGDSDSGKFWFDRKARSPYALPFTREEAAIREALWQTCERASSL